MSDFCTPAKFVKARKDYPCQACEWINEDDAMVETFTDEEIEQWRAAEKDEFKIKKGQIYLKCKEKFDGELSVFRARPEIDKICSSYNIYMID